MDSVLFTKEDAIERARELFDKASVIAGEVNKYLLFWFLSGFISSIGISLYIKLTSGIYLGWFITIIVLLLAPSLVILLSILTLADIIDLPNKISASKESFIDSNYKTERCKSGSKGLFKSIKELKSMFKFDFKTLFALLDLSGGIGSLTAILSPLFYIVTFISIALNFLISLGAFILLLIIIL